MKKGNVKKSNDEIVQYEKEYAKNVRASTKCDHNKAISWRLEDTLGYVKLCYDKFCGVCSKPCHGMRSLYMCRDGCGELVCVKCYTEVKLVEV